MNSTPVYVYDTYLRKEGYSNTISIDSVSKVSSYDRYIIILKDNGRAYVGRIETDVNCEGLVENGTSQIDITDFSNVVFKRV